MKAFGWFDSLPAKWSNRRLKYAAKLGNARTDGSPDGARYLGLENVESWTGRLIESEVAGVNPEDAVGADSVVNCFDRGDVLFGKLRPYLAKAHLAEASGVCTTELLVTKPASDMNGRFLLYSMLNEGFISLVDSSTFGSKMPRADWDFIGNMRVPVPPLPEQRAIAGFLDRETARLDALVAAKERWLELLAEKRRALITRAVTRGLNPAAPLRDSGLGWLGQIPARWSVVQFKFACANLQTGPFSSQLHAEDYIVDGTPVINPAHLENGRIVPDGRVTVDQDTCERLAVHRLQRGDVVFARRGELGRCGVVLEHQQDWLCGTGSLRARLCFDTAIPEYIAMMFSETEAAAWLALASVGSTMDNMNTEMLGGFRIPLPPVDEQRAIVAHISAEATKLDGLRAATERTIGLLKERRAALIAAAVGGKLELPASRADGHLSAVV
jgi:type I restriction enzyme S subunit